jgi:hypothetical protein
MLLIFGVKADALLGQMLQVHQLLLGCELVPLRYQLLHLRGPMLIFENKELHVLMIQKLLLLVQLSCSQHVMLLVDHLCCCCLGELVDHWQA